MIVPGRGESSCRMCKFAHFMGRISLITWEVRSLSRSDTMWRERSQGLHRSLEWNDSDPQTSAGPVLLSDRAKILTKMCNKAICDISHKRGPLDKALVKWSSRTLCPSLSAYALFFREVKRLTARKAVFVSARPTEFSITIISNDCLELFTAAKL